MSSSAKPNVVGRAPVLYPALAAQMTGEEVLEAIRSGAMALPSTTPEKSESKNLRKKRRKAAKKELISAVSLKRNGCQQFFCRVRSILVVIILQRRQITLKSKEKGN